jgi:hypothetical protein
MMKPVYTSENYGRAMLGIMMTAYGGVLSWGWVLSMRAERTWSRELIAKFSEFKLIAIWYGKVYLRSSEKISSRIRTVAMFIYLNKLQHKHFTFTICCSGELHAFINRCHWIKNHSHDSSFPFQIIMTINKGKVKRQSCPCAFFKLNTTPRRRIGEWRYSSTLSLTSVLGGDEWSASRPSRFTSRENAPGTHWIGGLVGPRAVLDAVKRKIPGPRRESNPRIPIIQPVVQR